MVNMGMAQWLEGLGGERMVDRPGSGLTNTPVNTAPAPTPTPEPPPAATVPPMPASLRNWLLANRSGYTALPQEMYDLFGGDEILKQLQQFDPNAQWTQTPQWGGEAGDGPMGYRLDYDPSKLPTVGGPGGGRHIADTGLVPVPVGGGGLHDPAMVYHDSIYGDLTPYSNVQREKDPWWTVAAPIAVGLLAPWAAGGLAAAGIGAPGMAGAVTGSGVAAGAGASPWWAKAIGRAPTIAKNVAGLVGGGATVNPKYTTPPMFPDPTFNPADYNSGGSPTKSNSDSKMVATQFAADPYGFSKGAG